MSWIKRLISNQQQQDNNILFESLVIIQIDCMRKHSLNHINSHQNIKILLNHDHLKKTPYLPESRSQKRDITKPKKYDQRKDGVFGSWLYESNKQNHKHRANIIDFGSKKAMKTKKNSCSYIGYNTSAEQQSDARHEGLNFRNPKGSNLKLLKPISLTDADVTTKQQSARNNLFTLYQKFKLLLNNYRQDLLIKQKKIKELRKQNKWLRDKCSKSRLKKN